MKSQQHYVVSTVVLIVSLCLFFSVCINFEPAAAGTTCLINRSNSLFRFVFVSVFECSPLPDSDPPMHGEVQSPLYPQPYPPNLQEQWDLSVPEGYQIQLTFTHLDIEASGGCYYDSLTVSGTLHFIYSITHRKLTAVAY